MKNIQEKHFNINDNQYQSEKILNPPLHVQDELNEIIKLIRKYEDSSDVVDFGSGNGRLTVPLLRNDFSVTAVDVSKKSLENLRKNARQVNKEKKLKTILTLPKKSKIICGTDILHHINIKDYFPLFYQSFKKGGAIIFSEPNIFNLSWIIFISLFLDWKVEKGIIQINYFNLIKQLKSAGFSQVKIIGLFLLPPMIFNWFPLLRKINMFLGNLPLLKLFSFRYIIVARR